MENNQTRAVAVIGRTGCGKSTFIKAMILDGNLSKDNIKKAETENRKLPKVSSSVQKCTNRPEVFPIPPIDGASYELVDFMGLQDTDKEDQKSLRQMAQLLGFLPALVGIIYIVDGRMTPAEANDCQFLFNEYFSDVVAKNLLVVRSKCSDLEQYDAFKEKLYLDGKIPVTIAMADWIAVNFSRKAPLDESRRQIQFLREKLGRWTQALELSDKTKIAFDYIPSYLGAKKYKKSLGERDNQLRSVQERLQKLKMDKEKETSKINEEETHLLKLQEEHAEQVNKIIDIVCDASPKKWACSIQ